MQRVLIGDLKWMCEIKVFQGSENISIAFQIRGIGALSVNRDWKSGLGRECLLMLVSS